MKPHKWFEKGSRRREMQIRKKIRTDLNTLENVLIVKLAFIALSTRSDWVEDLAIGWETGV